MAILDTVKKIGLRVKTATGYITYKLGSEFVQMDNGKDLQTAFDDLNGELTELNSKTETINKSGIDWRVTTHSDGRFEAFGTYSGYVSSSRLYEIDVPLPFSVQSVSGALVNPSYHAFYLSKWYINEPQTHSKDNLQLVFVTQNVSSQTDFKFDIYCEGTI